MIHKFCALAKHYKYLQTIKTNTVLQSNGFVSYVSVSATTCYG